MTPQHAKEMSGTAAIELIRCALQVQEHESLSQCANRMIAAYLHSGATVDIDTIERAIVAYSLQLDKGPMKWVHVFDAAQIAKQLLERIESRTCECGHQHAGVCPETECACMAFVRFRSLNVGWGK